MNFGPESGGVSEKAASFLSSLRSGKTQQRADIASEDAVRPLMARIEMLERRIVEMTKAQEEAERQKIQQQEAPPHPPNELMLFLQTKMELLESKLQVAQEEALRSTLLLREREEAQRKAQKEVEELFRSIREQGRSAQWDAKLREEFSASRRKIEDLEAKLRESQVRSMPVEEILPFLYQEEGRGELQRRLEEKLKYIRESTKTPAHGTTTELTRTLSPAATQESTQAETAPMKAGEQESVALMMGRLADLERRLEEAERERDQEKARRIIWEKDIMGAITKAPEEWKKSGGAELVVEAALENLAQTFKHRDAIAANMTATVERIQEEPPNSPEIPALRARLTTLQDQMQELQQTLAKHMAVVQAWLKQEK